MNKLVEIDINTCDIRKMEAIGILTKSVVSHDSDYMRHGYDTVTFKHGNRVVYEYQLTYGYVDTDRWVKIVIDSDLYDSMVAVADQLRSFKAKKWMNFAFERCYPLS